VEIAMSGKTLVLDSEEVMDACLDVARQQLASGLVDHIHESIAYQAAAVIEALIDLCNDLAASDEAEEIEMEIPQQGTVQ
jgi:uncharacterized protein YutE (UPF0331/DUF86 family)